MLEGASIRRSLSHFATNPLRTLLTLLGIVFGVGSVVAMVSVGEGAQREILATIEAMGATTTHVQARPVLEAEMSGAVNDSAGLSVSDVESLEALVGPVEAVAWRKEHALSVADLGVSSQGVKVLAVSPSMFEVHNLRVSQGRALVGLDDSRRHRVAVLGGALARRAFPEGAVGKQVRLEYSFFEVVGVLAERAEVGGELPVDPQVYQDAILIPYQALHEELTPAPAYGELDLISLKVASTEETLALKRKLEPTLRRLHGGVEDFEVVSPEELLQQRKAAQSVLNVVLISIAAISLVVGGIGIMNIMLANIMERIGEIGLRRAIGARRRDIRDQFLGEAVLICVLGGVVGVVDGVGGCVVGGVGGGDPDRVRVGVDGVVVWDLGVGGGGVRVGAGGACGEH
jgi:putative ABC transport system permease protein